jgi:hypothetical protein
MKAESRNSKARSTPLFLLFLLSAFAISAFGAQLHLNYGQAPNDHTGDTLRGAFSKIETNFTTLFPVATYILTNAPTVSGTNAATSVIGSGLGSATIPAFTNSLRRIHLLAGGLLTTANSPITASNLTLTLKIGSISTFVAGPCLLSNSLDAVTWRLDTSIVVPVGGATPALSSVTLLQIGAGLPYQNSGGASFNTLTNNPVDLTAQFANNNSTNALTVQHLILDVIPY